MPFEQQLLLAIHAHATPVLDVVFRLSHELGTFPFCTALVLGTALLHAVHGDREEAKLWLVLGISTALLQSGLKEAVGRPRPFLWPRLVPESSFSFPSGHALSSATFFPLLARAVARARPDWRVGAWMVGVAFAAYVGFGRLYLGVHWPTDVAAGWLIGATQTALALRWRDRERA
jgi:membrane-associated phospholipid phosphatase